MATATVPHEEEIEQHFPLVTFAIKNYANRGLQEADWDDLLQVGRIGLLRAIRNFDPSKGYTFSTFAVSQIRWETWAYLRKLKDLRRAKRIQFLSIEHPLWDEKMTMRDTLSIDDDVTAIQVKDFLSKLSTRERKIIIMRMAGAEQGEIGREVGISQAHVSRQLKRIGKKYLHYAEKGEKSGPRSEAN